MTIREDFYLHQRLNPGEDPDSELVYATPNPNGKFIKIERLERGGFETLLEIEAEKHLCLIAEGDLKSRIACLQRRLERTKYLFEKKYNTSPSPCTFVVPLAPECEDPGIPRAPFTEY